MQRMTFDKKKKVYEGIARFNRIKRPTNILFSALFIVLGLASVVPLLFVIIISVSSENSIARVGYSFIPVELDLQAYKYLWHNRTLFLNSLQTSLLVTFGGTALGLYLNATMGYVLSRRAFRLHKAYTVLIFIPMVFSGGMVSTYLIITQLYGLKNTVWALILPICISSFYVIVLRTFFTTQVPDSLIESGKLDGASQLRIFWRIVLPISLPAIATIGLFLTFAYWNDWFQAMLYIDDRPKFPLQYLLVQIDRQIAFLASNPQAMSAGAGTVKVPENSTRMAMVVLIVLPIACSYPFFQRYFITGLTVGAVKG